MKSISIKRICLVSVSAFSLTLTPALQAQTTTTTPTNPTGSEADTKTPQDSAAQMRNASTDISATAASAPDTTSSRNTTNTLDMNPSLAPTDSANNSGTKTPSTANSEDRSRSSAEGSSSTAFSDQHFLVKAAEGGMTEVQLGQIAQQKGASDDVKQFGAHMVMDHSKANDELKSLAQQKGVNVPTKLDTHHQAMVDRLNKLSGPAFDHAYVKAMVEDHQKDVAEFQRASTSAQDPDVKAFAAKTLTVIQSHLTDVQSKLK
jgi:putative membrane protein